MFAAFHMPRAMGVFKKVGFDAIGYPVGYFTPVGWLLIQYAIFGLSRPPCTNGSGFWPIGESGGSITSFRVVAMITAD